MNSNNKKDTIILEIESFNCIPDDVKERSFEIINNIDNIPRRRKKRKQIIFYILYCSYIQLGYSVHAKELGKLFGLSKGDISKTNGLFSSLNIQIKHNEQNAFNYLKIFCDKCNFNDDFKYELEKFYYEIINKQPDMKEETPSILASGIFKYFLTMRGIEYDKNNDFIEITGVSKATTDIYYKKISLIDNK